MERCFRWIGFCILGAGQSGALEAAEEKAQTAWIFLAKKVFMQGPWLPDVHCVQVDPALE